VPAQRAGGRLAPLEVIYYNIGVNFVSAGLAEDGVLCFTKAVALDPRYVDGYYQRALAYLKLG